MEGFIENLGEGPHALGTGDGDVGFSGWVVSVSVNPDGSELAGRPERGMPVRLNQVLYDLEQMTDSCAFFVEGVCGYPEL